MKKRLTAMLMVVALLVSLLSTGAMAVDGSEPTAAGTADNPITATDNNVTISKYVSGNSDDGYELTLEAYASNQTTTTTTTTPLDIVLVLDVSGSMDDPISTKEYDITRNTSWSYSDIYRQRTTYYHLAGDGNYYTVRAVRDNDNKYALVYGDDLSSATQLGKTGSSRSEELYNGYLYTLDSSSQPRIDALQTAVNGFIDDIAENARTNDVDHKISLVKFAGNKSNEVGNETYEEGYWPWYYEYNYSQIVTNLTSVNSESEVTELKEIVNSLEPMGATHADYGMEHAETVLESAGRNSKKVVIMFTDGEPTSGDSFEGSVANGAIEAAKNLKDAGVTVYTIGLFNGANPDGDSNSNRYMNGVSSNYPEATAYNSLGSRATGNYYFAADSAGSLEQVFEGIADSVIKGTLDNHDFTSSTFTDTLSQYFDFPDGLGSADVGSKITVKYAEATGYNNGTFTFGEPGDLPEDVEVAVNITGDSISVSGFDYGTYAATYDTETKNVTGGKLVITFPIVLDEAACVAEETEDGMYPTNSELELSYTVSDAPKSTSTDRSPEVEYDVTDYNANGTDITVQVYVDSVLQTDPLSLVEITRPAGDYDYFKHVGTADDGTLTYDFNYNPDPESGHDCVDIEVSLTDAASNCVVQGIVYNQSVGSGRPQDVNPNNGTYTIDNVTGVYDNNDDDGVDVKIYLRTAYTVMYNGEGADEDNNTYITKADIITHDTQGPESGNRVRKWYDSSLLTTITMQPVPGGTEGTTTSGWYTDAGCTGTEYNTETHENGVPVSTVSGTATNNVINFYYKSTAKTYTVTWMNGDTLLEKDENVAYNTKPSYGGDEPTKEADEENTYSFVGWSTDPNAATGMAEEGLPVVTDNVTYYAIFSSTTRQYSITINYVDDATPSNELKGSYTDNQSYGYEYSFSPSADTGAVVPTSITANDGKTYAFDHFEGTASGTLTENVEITAVYSLDENENGTPDKYEATVTYIVENGTWQGHDGVTEITQDFTIAEFDSDQNKWIGKTVTLGESIPTPQPNTGYDANSGKWQGDEPKHDTEVTGDETYTYTYSTKQQFTITFDYVDEDGKPLEYADKTDSIDYGDTYDFTGNDTYVPGQIHLNDVQYVYVGLAEGSDPLSTIEGVTGNVEITLVYAIDSNEDDIPDYKQVIVYFEADENGNVEGTLTQAFTAEEGAETVTFKPEDVTPVADTGYAFDIWTKDDGEEGVNPFTTTTAEAGTTITYTAHFAEDNIGEEDPNEGDGTPDKYQAKVTYKVVGGTWSENGTDTVTKVFTVYEKDSDGTWTPIEVTIDADDVPSTEKVTANSGYQLPGEWDTNPVGQEVVNGSTYTYTLTKDDPSLKVEKKADKESVNVGDTITYTITVKNTGNVALTDVVVDDEMFGTKVTSITVDDATEPTDVTEAGYTITTLPVGATVTITYSYTTTEADATNGVTNSVTVKAGDDGPEDGDKTETDVTDYTVTIAPADIVIYTGGDGYGGVIDDNGDLIEASESSGLPEPGYHLDLSEDLVQWLTENGVTVSDGDTPAEHLENIIHFEYWEDVNGENTMTRRWDLEYMGIYETDEKIGEPTRYVYRLVSVNDNQVPVRLAYGDGELITDDIVMSENSVSETHDITIYAGGIEQGNVIAVAKIPQTDGSEAKVKVNCSTEVGTGKLTIRSTVDDGNSNTAINAAPSTDAVTAHTNGEVTFYVNDTEVIVDQNRVQLLLDQVSNNADFNAAMGEDAIATVLENNNLSDASYQLVYMDLVDTQNGNAVVTMGVGDSLKIYWPVPDDAASGSDFYIVHYYEMNREGTIDDIGNAATHQERATVEVVDGQRYVTFDVDSFSPFVLVYETDDGYDPIIPTPDDDTEYVPKWLNTEDHFAYIVGYEDGEVKPNNNITRAEVATIFFRLLTDDARARYWSQTNDYSDVAAESWYNNAISTLSNMGIINGYEDGTFKPNAPITRAEFTAIATRFFDYTAEYDGAFNDVSRSAWYADCVQAAVDMGLVDGYPDGGFHPNSNITRAEAVTIVNRVLNRAPHEDHLLDEDEMNVWPDNVYGAWYYADMQEATNSHDYDWIRVSGERVEEWTEKLPERDWAALEQEWSSAYSG